MRLRRSQRGSALTMTMMAAALLLPLGAVAVFVARTGLLIQQSAQAETDAFYRAEAGLEWAVAALPPDQPPAVLAAGPDGLPGTNDDGQLPSSPPPGLATLLAPIDVRLATTAPGLLRLTATATSARQTSKALEQLVRQRPDPYTPGAVYLDQAPLPAFGAPPFIISGYAHTRSDPIGTPSGSDPPAPAIAFGPAAATAVLAGLASLDPTRLVGLGGSPSLSQVQPLDLTAIAGRAGGRADAVAVDSASVALALGSTATPQLSVLAADAVVHGNWQGAGILVVRGRLTVSGTLDFAGLVIATAGLVVESAGNLQLRGGLWLGQSPFETRGAGGIASCPSCLAASDAAIPGLLPHRYAPCGWREIY